MGVVIEPHLCTTRTRPRCDLSVTWPSQGNFPQVSPERSGTCADDVLALLPGYAPGCGLARRASQRAAWEALTKSEDGASLT